MYMLQKLAFIALISFPAYPAQGCTPGIQQGITQAYNQAQQNGALQTFNQGKLV